MKRAGKTLLTGALVAATATSGLVMAQSASAAPPAFPNNIVVFPDRDFVTIEGFQNRVGQTATLEVVRGGTVVGSAESVVAAGDVAFEVNHPGGACWGAGTGLNVTPNIVAGDQVQIRFGTTVLGDTVVQDAAVGAKTTLVDADTVRVTGNIAAGVNRNQVEQRVINPDLKDTSIGRRDIRAVPGTTNDTGYNSTLTFAGNTFTATYDFTGADRAAVASAVAAGGGERFMSWQVQDTAGNRQGLTIAEFGEAGGPGMGGCPAGPLDSAAPAGSYSAVTSADKTSGAVNWTAATPLPGAAAVTGYSVVAIETAAAGAPARQIGMRVGASATSTTITGLDPAKTYTYEVRSIAGARMSEAFTPASTGGPTTGTGTQDGTGPELTTTPAFNGDTAVSASSVTVAGSADVYYTVDGTDVLTGDMPSATAKVYTGPIPVTAANTRVNIVGFDAAGDTTSLTGVVSPAPAAAAVAPTNVKLEGTGAGSATVSWTAVPDATEYRIRVKDRTDATATAAAVTSAVLTQYDTVVTSTSGQVTGLPKSEPGHRYVFQVQAKTPAATTYGALSTGVTAIIAGDAVAIELADYRTGNEFRLGGSASMVTNAAGQPVTITVHRSNAAGTAPGTAIAGATTTVVPAVAPEVGGDWGIRLAAPLPANPGTVWIKSSEGGIAGPFTVTVR